MDFTKDLNPAQAQVVEHTAGPLLVLAGAGSGKTKALTHRVANLLVNQGVSQDEILALTFTNKAAGEMRSRLGELIHKPVNWYFMPWMGTFHSICIKILRESGAAIKLDPKFVIFDEADKKATIKRALQMIDPSSKLKPAAIGAMISRAKNQGWRLADYQAAAKSQIEQTVASVFERYEQLKNEAKGLDFDDILLETLRLLQHKPTRQQWQDQFKFILIDEYQDTNHVQYQITKLLTNSQQNLCVVGDDWQSIYSWRGADFTNILNFKRDYPSATEIFLEQNYRSTAPILEAAQAVIEHNQIRSHKKIWTDLTEGDPVGFKLTSTPYQEAEQAVRLLQSWQKQGAELNQMAILYRTNAQSMALERVLRTSGLSYKIIGGVRFSDRAEIKDTLAYLRLLYQPSDSASLVRIINKPARGIGAVTLNRFLAWQRNTDYDFLTALQHLGESDLTKPIQNKLAAFGRIMNNLQQEISANTAPAHALEQILSQTGYLAALDDGSPESEDRIENLRVLVEDARQYADLETYLTELALASSTDESAKTGQVSLMTVHAAKGLEFDFVIVVGLNEGVFPHARSLDDPAQLEEERRLCYVAMTRARQQLHLLAAERDFANFLLPSRFLTECGVLSEDGFMADFDFADEAVLPFVNLLQKGDRVRSAIFGSGKVTKVDQALVEVAFDDGVTRKLNVEYANLEKLA